MSMRNTAGIAMEGERGTSLIEYALLLPLLLLLMLNTINFGMYFFAWITINNAARAAAEYYIYNGAAVGLQSIPTYQQVSDLVGKETSFLPYSSTVVLSICRNNSSGATPSYTCETGGGTTTPQADPEPAKFVSSGITVGYSYQPIFGIFTLPVINVPLTLGPSTVTRQVLMRSMW